MSDHIVWMDLEMTGLDPLKNAIIEMATLITDSDLNIVAEGPEFIIHQPPETFALMDEWNQTHHTNSGLWKQVINSQIAIKDAEIQTVEFLKKHLREKTAPLAGNSIWQDRRFLSIHTPELENFLHYRIIDVSSIKELAKRWYGEQKIYNQKKGAHRAMDDIKESLAELRYYKENLFVK